MVLTETADSKAGNDYLYSEEHIHRVAEREIRAQKMREFYKAVRKLAKYDAERAGSDVEEWGWALWGACQFFQTSREFARSVFLEAACAAGVETRSALMDLADLIEQECFPEKEWKSGGGDVE